MAAKVAEHVVPTKELIHPTKTRTGGRRAPFRAQLPPEREPASELEAAGHRFVAYCLQNGGELWALGEGVSEFEALDFAGGGLWELVDHDDLARAFERSHSLTTVVDQEFFGWLSTRGR